MHTNSTKINNISLLGRQVLLKDLAEIRYLCKLLDINFKRYFVAYESGLYNLPMVLMLKTSEADSRNTHGHHQDSNDLGKFVGDTR